MKLKDRSLWILVYASIGFVGALGLNFNNKNTAVLTLVGAYLGLLGFAISEEWTWIVAPLAGTLAVCFEFCHLAGLGMIGEIIISVVAEIIMVGLVTLALVAPSLFGRQPRSR